MTADSVRLPVAVTQSYNMIEDRNLAMIPPLSSSLSACFTSVQNQSATGLPTELVTVSNQNNLLHIRPDSGSATGWSHDEILVDGAPAAAIDKIISFYQAGTLFVLVHYPAGDGEAGNQVLGMQRTDANGWGPILIDQDSDLENALGQMSQTDCFVAEDGTVFVYGQSLAFGSDPVFVLITVDPASGQFEIVDEENGTSNGSYRLLPGYGQEQICVLTLQGNQATFQCGSISDGTFNYAGNPTTYNLGLGPLSSKQVFPIPGDNGDASFLLLDDEQQLFLISGYSSGTPNSISLTGAGQQPAGVQWVDVGVDSTGRFLVFAIDTVSNQLWLLRQSEASVGGPVAFEDWVQLGNNLSAIACPNRMIDGPELFYYDLKARLCHLNQALDSTIWYTNAILSPSQSPDSDPAADITTYTQELTLVDADGQPVPGAVVEIQANQKLVLVVNSLAYHVAPGYPATVAADYAGRMTVSSTATALSSPALTVTLPSADGSGNELGPYRADYRVHHRLSGKDPNFPVNVSTLKSAGLMPSDISNQEANGLAEKLNILGGAAVTMQQPAPLSDRTDITPQYFAIDFTPDGRMITRDLTEQEYSARLSVQPAGTPTLSLGSIFGDIAHFIRHVIQDLSSIAVKIEKNLDATVVHFAMEVAGELKRYVLTTVAEVAGAIEVVLARIASFLKEVVDAVETAIRWLRMLFDWGDIINTKAVIRYYVETGLSNLATDLGTDLPSQLIAHFTTLRSDLDSAFDSVIAQYQGTGSFNQAMPPNSANPALAGGPPLQAGALRQTHRDNSVQCNYAKTKVAQHYANNNVLGLTTGGVDVTALLTAFGSAFDTNDLQNRLQTARTSVQGLKDRDSFFNLMIADLLTGIKDLLDIILKGIEKVLTALANIAADAVTSILEMMTATIHIPILSNIYLEIAKQPLSILDLMCLVIAVPATIIYKIIYGGAQATAPFSADDVNRITTKPITWPTYSGESKAVAQPDLPGDDPEILLICSLLAGVFYAIEDPLFDFLAAGDQDASEPGLDLKFPNGLSLVAIVTSVAVAMLGAPYGTFEKSGIQRTAADNWSIALWATGWIPTLFDIAFVVCDEKGCLTRFVNPAGPFIMTACGIVLIGIGSKTVSEMHKDPSYNAADEVAALIGAFPYIFKPAIMLGLTTEVGLGANVALCAIDFSCDLGATVANIVGAATAKTEE